MNEVLRPAPPPAKAAPNDLVPLEEACALVIREHFEDTAQQLDGMYRRLAALERPSETAAERRRAGAIGLLLDLERAAASFCGDAPALRGCGPLCGEARTRWLDPAPLPGAGFGPDPGEAG